MAKYRKKPVVVEAVVWQGKYFDGTEWPDWFRELVNICKLSPQSNGTLHVVTLEGIIVANKGDMIIKGVNGEVYPCKPDIFKKTYEFAE